MIDNERILDKRNLPSSLEAQFPSGLIIHLFNGILNTKFCLVVDVGFRRKQP